MPAKFQTASERRHERHCAGPAGHPPRAQGVPRQRLDSPRLSVTRDGDVRLPLRTPQQYLCALDLAPGAICTLDDSVQQVLVFGSQDHRVLQPAQDTLLFMECILSSPTFLMGYWMYSPGVYGYKVEPTGMPTHRQKDKPFAIFTIVNPG